MKQKTSNTSHETNSWFFEKIHKIVRPLHRLIKKERKDKITNIWNKKEEGYHYRS